MVLDIVIVVSDRESYEEAISDGYINIIKMDITDDIELESLNVKEG